MAGFFSVPSLGFASTAGSFIKGAADQANANIEADNQLQNAWAARADEVIGKRNQELKDLEKQRNMYNVLLQTANGDTGLAGQGMAVLAYNPKTDIGALQSSIRNAISQPGYQKSNDTSYQDSLDQRMHGNMAQSNSLANRFPTMNQPYQPTGTGQQGQSQFGGNSSGYPETANGNIPISSINNPSTSSSNIPTTPTPNSVIQSQTTGGSGLIFPSKTDKPMTPYEKARIEQEQKNTDIRNKQYELQERTKPPSFDEQQGAGVIKGAIEHYLYDPKTGLQAQHAELQKLGGQAQDVNNMMDMLNAGFKASAPQDVYDNLNRFTTSILGLDLSSLGISNQVNDTNYMKKVIAQGIINRLSQLHFGRITNAEMGMVEKGFSSPKNDPDTNIKIALMLKNSIDWAIKEHTAQWDVMGKSALPAGLKDQNELMAKARNAGSDVYGQYLKQNAPWAQFDPRKATTPDAQKIMYNSLPTDSWIENMADRHMYYKSSRDGMLHQAGTDING